MRSVHVRVAPLPDVSPPPVASSPAASSPSRSARSSVSRDQSAPAPATSISRTTIGSPRAQCQRKWRRASGSVGVARVTNVPGSSPAPSAPASAPPSAPASRRSLARGHHTKPPAPQSRTSLDPTGNAEHHGHRSSRAFIERTPPLFFVVATTPSSSPHSPRLSFSSFSTARRYRDDLYIRSSHFRSTHDLSSIGRVHRTHSKGSAQGLDSTPTSTFTEASGSTFIPELFAAFETSRFETTASESI